MKRSILAFAAVSIMLVFCSPALAETGNFNLLLGRKTLEKSDWEPLEEQFAASLHLDVTPDGWPVAFAVDFLGSATQEDNYHGSGWDLEASTGEYDFGVRKFFGDVTGFAGFIGGGLGYFEAEAKTSFGGLSGSEDGSGFGFWIDGGIQGRAGTNLNLGLDLRISRAKVDVGGVDVEAGGTTFGVYIGYGW
jgi:hypothetical protein